eukprot:GHVU01062546.1.p1 GENE.GHVU01062546.1~~GHVU01062546.1.p1  ORF type:complete len:111 (+),score=3.15 GHVU01062546.1:198-530(+)
MTAVNQPEGGPPWGEGVPCLKPLQISASGSADALYAIAHLPPRILHRYCCSYRLLRLLIWYIFNLRQLPVFAADFPSAAYRRPTPPSKTEHKVADFEFEYPLARRAILIA